MKVYKVFDDEWTEIKGSGQLKEFAIMQTSELLNCNSDEEIEEAINISSIGETRYIISSNIKNRVRELVKAVSENSITEADITDEEAIELLKLRFFEVEELYIY